MKPSLFQHVLSLQVSPGLLHWWYSSAFDTLTHWHHPLTHAKMEHVTKRSQRGATTVPKTPNRSFWNYNIDSCQSFPKHTINTFYVSTQFQDSESLMKYRIFCHGHALDWCTFRKILVPIISHVLPILSYTYLLCSFIIIYQSHSRMESWKKLLQNVNHCAILTSKHESLFLVLPTEVFSQSVCTGSSCFKRRYINFKCKW